MRRASITVPDELDAALQAYVVNLPAAPSLTTIVQEALRAYLTERGYPTESRQLKLSPADKGSGRSDVSAEHDREFAQA